MKYLKPTKGRVKVDAKLTVFHLPYIQGSPQLPTNLQSMYSMNVNQKTSDSTVVRSLGWRAFLHHWTRAWQTREASWDNSGSSSKVFSNISLGGPDRWIEQSTTVASHYQSRPTDHDMNCGHHAAYLFNRSNTIWASIGHAIRTLPTPHLIENLTAKICCDCTK